jgi:uncharacterized protein (TIGR02453 family)
MSQPAPIFTRETFRFFADLARNNRKDWMDQHRERYQAHVVQPFRRLCDEVSPSVMQLDPNLGTGSSYSRINRDIRFAKDKTPYRPQMYLKFCAPFSGPGETGELYIGLSAKTCTIGFRIYGGSKRKESSIAMIAEPRLEKNPRLLAQQKARLGRKYESYWYRAEKKEWREQKGWPAGLDDWKKLQGWIVRRKLPTASATRSDFAAEIAKAFRDVYPVLRFTSLES